MDDRRLGQAKRTPVIVFLAAASSGTLSPVLLPAFRRGLEELGFIEGRNVLVEYVWADGLYDRLPPLAAELVRRRVDIYRGGGRLDRGACRQRGYDEHPDHRACRR